MERRLVEQVRSFNRMVTQRIGALEDSYLSRGRPLGEARLIFEAGVAEGIEVRALRRKLKLDAGYLSRLLRSLESQRLIEVYNKADDGRVRAVRLTERGRAEFDAYDRLSDELAETILAPLGSGQRSELVAAMGEVERLLRSALIEIAIEPAESKDARWCLNQYFDELNRRFDSGFDVAKGKSDAAAVSPDAYFVVARIDGEPVGCGALRQLGPGIGEVKRVWTSTRARGQGVAASIVRKLEAIASERGMTTLRLDTNRVLTEAHALYRKLGYHEIERYNDNPYAHRWFEKRL